MPNMDESKQAKILNSKALVLCGAESTCYAVSELVQSGFGEITVLKTVPETEQLIDTKLKGLYSQNSDVKLNLETFDGLENLELLVSKSTIVLESLLNWQLKLGLSDIAMNLNIPLVHSGCVGHRYQVYSMVPGKSACLRCVFPQVGIEDFPLGAVEAHPLTSVEAWAGALMAIDALKIACDLGVIQSRSLWRLDALSGDFEVIRNLAFSEDCPDCGPDRRALQ